jgi:PAS domain-containing protein
MDPDIFFSGIPAAVTVCDAEGLLLYMNPAAETLFAKDGGRALLGSNLFDCHPEAAREKIRALMRDRKSNVYTVERSGKKRLIYQSPWYREGALAGLVEVSFEVPAVTPNLVRK